MVVISAESPNDAPVKGDPASGSEPVKRKNTKSVSLRDSVYDDKISLSLQENIYSACLVLPHASFADNTEGQDAFLDYQVMFLLFVNCFIQISLVIYVWVIYKQKLNDDELGVCGGYKTHKILRWVCVVVYTGYCVADLMETFNMFTWLVSITGNPLPEWMQSCCKPICCCFNCCFKAREESGHEEEFGGHITNREGEETHICTGIARGIKNQGLLRMIYSYCGVVFFKFGAGMALAVYGTGFVIMTTENEELILNAMALTFVLDIDEMVYSYCLSSEMKQVVEEFAPVVQLEMNEKQETFYRQWGIIVRCAFLGAISVGTMQAFCK